MARLASIRCRPQSSLILPSATTHVTLDGVGARVGRHGVDVDFQIAEAVLVDAGPGEQAGHRDERRRRVGLALHPHGLRRRGAGDRGAVGQIGMQLAGPAGQVGRVLAGRHLGVAGRLAEPAVGRRRDGVAEASNRRSRSRSGWPNGRAGSTWKSAGVLAFVERQAGAHHYRGDDLGLVRLAVDPLGDQADRSARVDPWEWPISTTPRPLFSCGQQ